MKRTFLPISSLLGLILFALSMPLAALADSSHARIVRLSLIQGDVRFAAQFHEDSVTDPKAVWEVAQLNLPIRQGNALSTGNGRAEVEFENGAMAFLAANTVIEFYDLSLNDGDRITRLILRQGSASFHELSQSGDYFSVTGGDFSVAADGRATFRLENFDDGSTLNVLSGHVLVLQNDKSTPLEKGQSLSVHVQDGGKQVIGRATPNDDFDRWVSSRVQNEEVVNSQVPTNGSSSSYVSGYSDLYTYGSWLSVGASTIGGRTVSAWAGRLLIPVMEVGTSIKAVWAGHSLVLRPGAGCPTTTAVGFLRHLTAGSGIPVAFSLAGLSPTIR